MCPAAIPCGMKSVLPILLVIALVAVLGVLLMGVVTMLRGGEFNRKYANTLMRARVALQAGALLLFVLLVLATRMG